MTNQKIKSIGLIFLICMSIAIIIIFRVYFINIEKIEQMKQSSTKDNP